MKDKAANGGRIKNMRRRTRVTVVCAVLLLVAVMVAGVLFGERAIHTDFSRKNVTPCRNMGFPRCPARSRMSGICQKGVRLRRAARNGVWGATERFP